MKTGTRFLRHKGRERCEVGYAYGLSLYMGSELELREPSKRPPIRSCTPPRRPFACVPPRADREVTDDDPLPQTRSSAIRCGLLNDGTFLGMLNDMSSTACLPFSMAPMPTSTARSVISTAALVAVVRRIDIADFRWRSKGSRTFIGNAKTCHECAPSRVLVRTDRKWCRTLQHNEIGKLSFCIAQSIEQQAAIAARESAPCKGAAEKVLEKRTRPDEFAQD